MQSLMFQLWPSRLLISALLEHLWYPSRNTLNVQSDLILISGFLIWFNFIWEIPTSMELTLGLPCRLLVLPEYTLPQTDEILEEAAMEAEKEEEMEKRRRRSCVWMDAGYLNNYKLTMVKLISKVNGHLTEITSLMSRL